jgi:hypothetical protein
VQDAIPVAAGFLLSTLHAKICAHLRHHPSPLFTTPTPASPTVTPPRTPRTPGSRSARPHQDALNSEPDLGAEPVRERIAALQPTVLRSPPQGHADASTQFQHPAIVANIGELVVLTGGQIVALCDCALVMLGCSVSLVGLAYLIIALVLATYSRPHQARLRTPAATSHTPRPVLSVTRSRHWTLLAALALICTCHIAAQYLLIVTDVLQPSARQCRFLEEVVGISCNLDPPQAALRLSVPFLLLAVLHAYRFFYSAASDEAPAASQASSARRGQSHTLLNDTSYSALLRRAAVRHAHKLLVAMCFAVAVSAPSALGALLLLGALLSVLGVGGPAGTRVRGFRRTRSATIYLCATLTTCWVTVQYAVCIAWLRDTFLPAGSQFRHDLLQFLGVPVVQVRFCVSVLSVAVMLQHMCHSRDGRCAANVYPPVCSKISLARFHCCKCNLP